MLGIRLAPLVLLLSGATLFLWNFLDAQESSGLFFRDVASESGLDFININGIREKKTYIPESKGGGAAFLDYDNDGWLDVLMAQGSTIDRYRSGDNPHPELYRNCRDGTFEKVTEKAGLVAGGWGMGVTWGDYDNDGFVDLYLTNLGPNRLYRNRGDGTFEDVTSQAGVGDPSWSTSAGFADYDGDGDLDLYVANYLYINFDSLPAPSCQHRDAVVLCGPRGLPGQRDVLYRNNGDGTFSDVSETSGAFDKDRLYGLGVVWGDVDNDGDQDLYVANDATPNYLFVNQGDGSFEEMGLIAGVAVSGEGREQASMGVDLADYDNDGWLDAYMTHFADDYSTLFHNEGDLIFRDVTARAHVMQGEIGLVSWGTRFYDLNQDGWKDIFHSNGHVYPYLIDAGISETFDEPETLYLNRKDGTFENVTSQAGPDLSKPAVSRGVAFGDYDNDGDIDMLVVHLNGKPSLLRNESSQLGNWLMFKTRGSQSNRDGFGTRITVTTEGLQQIWEIKAGGSIYSAGDSRAHFGLGTAQTASVQVRWPSGKIQQFDQVGANHHYLIDEANGLQEESAH